MKDLWPSEVRGYFGHSTSLTANSELKPTAFRTRDFKRRNFTVNKQVEARDLEVGFAPIVVKPPNHGTPPPIAVGLTADGLFGIGKGSVQVFLVNTALPRFFDDHFQPFPFRVLVGEAVVATQLLGLFTQDVANEIDEGLPTFLGFR